MKNISIGDKVKCKSGDLQIINIFYRNHNKYYKYRCLTCGIEDSKAQSNIHRTGCRVCVNQRIVCGINDLWTEDGYKYSKYSTKKTDWICPVCHNVIHNISIRQVSSIGRLNCSLCSNGISFPNRIMANLLSQLQIEYLREYSPKWANNYRYDFFIPNKSLIIEMDGGYGHGHKGTKSEKENQIFIDEEKTKLAIEHNLRIFRIDCNYPNLDSREAYIISSILSSNLSKELIFNDCNIKLAVEQSLSNDILHASELYSTGVSIREIADSLNVHPVTVSRYLKKAMNMGLCVYSPKERRNIKYGWRKRKIIAIDKCGNTNLFDSIIEASKCLFISRSSIGRCLNGTMKMCKGYTFSYVNT